MAALTKRTIDDRVYYETDRNLYDVTKPEYCDVIANAHEVDPDNGRVGAPAIAFHSQVVGIMLDLEYAGYSIKRKPWFIPRKLWDAI